jgi:hypothetical protein
MNGGQQNLCFFSTRCRYSQAFLEELARSPYSREFRFVCVDPTPAGVRPSLPPYVRAVPTLMIAGEREPRTDGRVMEWLTERRMRDRAETTAAAARPAAPGGGRPAAGPMEPMMGDGPAAVFGMDLNGIGDEGFAFLDDDTAATTTSMVRMGGTMAAYGNYTAMNPMDTISHVGGAAPFADPGGPSKQSAKAKAMDDAMARLMASRDSDIHIPPPIQRK